MNECTKCDKKYVDEVILIGGYVAHLCTDCRNKFTDYMDEHHGDKREEYCRLPEARRKNPGDRPI